MLSLFHSYKQSVSYTAIAKIITIFSRFAVVFAMNAIFDKAVFGAFMLALSVCLFACNVVAGFFGNLILYHIPADRNHPIKVFSLWSGAILGVIMASIFAGIAYIGGYDVMIFMAVLMPFYLLTTIIGRTYQANENIKNMAVFQDIIPGCVLMFGIAIYAVTGNNNITGVTGIYIAAYALSVVLYCAYERPQLLTVSNALSLFDLKHGTKMTMASILRRSSEHLLNIFTGYLGGTVMVADVTVAMRLAQCIMIPKNLIAPLLIPRIRSFFVNENNGAFIREYDGVRNIALLITLFAVMIAIICGEFALSLFGDYTAVYPLLIMLCFHAVLHAALPEIGWFMPMAGHAGAALLFYFAGFIGLVIGMFVFIPVYGVTGVGAAVILQTLIVYIAMHAFLQKRYAISLMTYPLWLCLISCCIGVFVIVRIH